MVYTGNVSASNAYFLAGNTTTISVTNKLGYFRGSNTVVGNTSGANFVINNLAYEKKPDIIVGSGDILYAENFEPINRSNTQTETIKLVLSF